MHLCTHVSMYLKYDRLVSYAKVAVCRLKFRKILNPRVVNNLAHMQLTQEVGLNYRN